MMARCKYLQFIKYCVCYALLISTFIGCEEKGGNADNAVQVEIKNIQNSPNTTLGVSAVRREPIKDTEIVNEKEKPRAVLTIDENFVVTRSEVDAKNISWYVVENGQEVLDRNAENEYSYQYYSNKPGNTYEITLHAWVDGGYEAISNTVTYTVPN